MISPISAGHVSPSTAVPTPSATAPLSSSTASIPAGTAPTEDKVAEIVNRVSLSHTQELSILKNKISELEDKNLKLTGWYHYHVSLLNSYYVRFGPPPTYSSSTGAGASDLNVSLPTTTRPASSDGIGYYP